MEQLKQLIKEVEEIKQRNKKVEADKSWETSLSRKIIISVLTYLVIAVFFYYAKLEHPLKNAAVPAVAFFLSTLTLPIFKNLWLKAYKIK